MFQLRLKTALTNEAEILQNFIIEKYLNRCDYNFMFLGSIFVLMVMPLKKLFKNLYIDNDDTSDVIKATLVVPVGAVLYFYVDMLLFVIQIC